MIRLDYRDARPIYEQVRDGLRSLMVTGVLAAGEKLPSVRSLATELAINPNTIQRAYSQLETEGYVYTVSGRGTFVCEVREQNRQRRAEVTARVQPLMEELRDLGMTREEWTDLWKGGDNSLKPLRRFVHCTLISRNHSDNQGNGTHCDCHDGTDRSTWT